MDLRSSAFTLASLASALGLLGLSACIPGLKQEVERSEVPLVAGRVYVPEGTAHDESVVVALFKEDARGQVVLERVAQLDYPWAFAFPVEAQGDFTVFGWLDSDRDLDRDPLEPLAIEGLPEALHVVTKSDANALELRARLGVETPAGYALELGPHLEEIEGSYRVTLGRSVTLDDPIFDPSRGTLGLWKPTKFLDEWGFGIYVVGEWDPDKIPVLLVYGMSGSPDNWRWLLEHLDSDRYQFAFFDYPTGVRMGRVAQALATMLEYVYDNRRVPELHIVAHSMGGLVARGAILELLARGADPDWISSFTTISTPWQGHSAAEQGVKMLETPVPAWIDMSPGSEYLQLLFADSLRGRVDYNLLFGYYGRKRFDGNQSDGAVTIASQLDLRAQDEALKVRGLDFGHVDILESPETAAFLEAALEAGHARYLERVSSE